jgi:hypothetical protein
MSTVLAEEAKPKANPRDGWPAWTDSDRWEPTTEPDPEDTRDHATAAVPSARNEAFHLGYGLGLDREDAAPPDHFGPELVGEFEAGWATGRREWDRRLEIMCGSAEYSEFSNGISERDIYANGGVS